MDIKIAGKAFGVWVLIVIFSGMNGWVRDLVLVPEVGKISADVIASIAVIAFVFAVTYLFLGTLRPLSTGTLIGMGVFWIALGALLEAAYIFLLGRGSWESMNKGITPVQYIFSVLIWVAVLISPVVCGLVLRGKRSEGV